MWNKFHKDCYLSKEDIILLVLFSFGTCMSWNDMDDKCFVTFLMFNSGGSMF